MAIGRSSSSAGPVEGTRNIEGSASSAWRTCFVALDLADTARIACFAQANCLVLVVLVSYYSYHSSSSSAGGLRRQLRTRVGVERVARLVGLLLQDVVYILELGIYALLLMRLLRLMWLLLLLLLEMGGRGGGIDGGIAVVGGRGRI